MPDQDIVVDPSEVKPVAPGGVPFLRYPPVAGTGDIEVDPSQISTAYDPASAAAAQAALERGPEVRPQGAPLFQVASKPETREPPPMTPTEALITNPAKQFVAPFFSAAAGANRLTANTASLLDTAISKISSMTGLAKPDLFKHVEDWAREQQKGQEQTAAELSGGRKDIPSQVFRGAGNLLFGAPAPATAAAAGTLIGGPVGGAAALGALGGLETADEGWKSALIAAAQNAATGGAFTVMGPASRPIRLAGSTLMTYAQLVLDGVPHDTALANALSMGAASALHGGGKTAGEIMRDATAPGAALRPEWSVARSTLNPTQQAAVDYLREQGVPLTGGQQTGNKYLTAIEATTAHTPLGAQKAREFHAGTESALRDLAGELAGEAHGEPVSPYEAGTIVGDTLTHSIAELAGQADQAYEKAWEHAGDPAYTKKVQIKTATEPVLDAAGQPTGQTKRVPVYGDVNMPVDVRWMKAIARDQLPKYEYLPAAERAQSAAYSILKGIGKGNDHISAQQAEEALKGLKAEVGYGTDPNMRNVAQGVAAQMIPRLQKAIDAAVGESGQDAVTGLQEGRKLHARKMDFAEVQKKLREEPVQAFGQLTQGRDSGVNYLKEIARRAPDSLPVLGRAYLDTLFDKAMKEGGWMRTDGVFKAWDSLGDQTKALLFPKEGQVKALDRFFLAQKITAERINTSGTALVKEAQDAGTNLLKWLKGKYAGDILFSPKGIRFLTGIAQDPPRSSAEVTALEKRAQAVFGKPPEEPPEPPEAGTPTGGAPPAADGGRGGAAPAQNTPTSRREAFIDRLKELLSSEEAASPSRRGRPMGLQELMGQPEKVPGGEEAPRQLKLKPTGEGGQLLTSDLGQALENSVSGRYRLGKEASPQRRMARALESMIADLRYALAEDDGGRGWYTDDVATMEKLLTKARPEFKQPEKMALFKYLLGVTSNGVDPEVNFDAALRGWDMYQRDGRFSAYDKTKTSEFGNPKGLGLTFRANSYEGAMDRLSRLVADQGGEAGAVEWLRTKHPVSELKQYYKDVPGKATDERYGAYILGEKVGAFGSNLNGIHTELTADKWWNRTWNRWMGTMMDTDKEGNVRFDDEGNPLLQDAPRNEGERNLMRETAAKVADELGLNVSELQAILWYAEQRLYRFYGIDASSVSYADAARKQFGGDVRPAEDAVDRGPAKSGGPNANNGKAGRSPPKVP
jgi:hypothetical protein